MASRRVLQNALLQSIRLSSKRAFVAVPATRVGFVTNKGALTTAYSNNGFFVRNYNTQAPHSDIFKVVDFNDIQTIIKREGKGYDLIDVREEKEVVQGAIPTAKNVPLSQFAQAWTLSDSDFKSQFGFEKPKKESQVILYCLGGVRSTRAAEHLHTLGYKNLENYVGSWADYVEKTKQ